MFVGDKRKRINPRPHLDIGSEAQFKMRECMTNSCKNKFLSTHSGHRHCEKCRNLEASPGDKLYKVHV